VRNGSAFLAENTVVAPLGDGLDDSEGRWGDTVSTSRVPMMLRMARQEWTTFVVSHEVQPVAELFAALVAGV